MARKGHRRDNIYRLYIYIYMKDKKKQKHKEQTKHNRHVIRVGQEKHPPQQATQERSVI